MRALIRADASAEIGTGHVMRSLALAQALRDNGADVTLGHASLPAPLADRFAAEGVVMRRLTTEPGSRADASQTTDVASEMGADWVVVDGYAFGADYLAAVRSAAWRVLAVDDLAKLSRYPVDIVVNQNVYADATRYATRAAGARLLLGPRYAVLRREFGAWLDWRRTTPPQARRVVVTLGGSDPDAATSRVLAALGTTGERGLDVRVVVGAANPRHREIAARAVAHGGHRGEVVVDVQDMAGMLAWAEVGIGAGGTSALEMAFMGVPALLFVLADNQVEPVAALVAAGTARRLGPPSDSAPEQIAAALCELLDDAAARDSMARRGRELVDGRGAWRVVREMVAAAVDLRPVTEGDARILWEWANDPGTRRASFSSEPIPWEAHVDWLRSQLADSSARLYLGVDRDGRPIGVVRFQWDDGQAVISITVAPSVRGQGYGTALIRRGCEALRAERPSVDVHAYIKPDNAASLSAFGEAGFLRRDDAVVAGRPAIHMVLQPSGGDGRAR